MTTHSLSEQSLSGQSPFGQSPFGQSPFGQSLLGNVAAADISDRPFAHIAATNVLAPERYDRLQASFPSLEKMGGGPATETAAMENAALRLSSKAVLKDSSITPEWREFFDYHTSAAFWGDIVRLLGDRLRAAHPGLERRVGKPLQDFAVGRRGESGAADIRLECQFVVNTPLRQASSVKTPHVDKRETLFAGLFYMRADGDETPGGDLDLYEWKRKPRFLPYRMILPRDVAQVGSVAYAANSFAGFVNSAAAVHGVSPRMPTTRVRRYINLVAEVPFHLFRAPLISLPAALGQWKEVQQIRRQKYG